MHSSAIRGSGYPQRSHDRRSLWINAGPRAAVDTHANALISRSHTSRIDPLASVTDKTGWLCKSLRGRRFRYLGVGLRGFGEIIMFEVLIGMLRSTEILYTIENFYLFALFIIGLNPLVKQNIEKLYRAVVRGQQLHNINSKSNRGSEKIKRSIRQIYKY